jgi:hypothetical protein
VRSSLAVPIRTVEQPEACVHGNAWIAAIGAACAELPALARNVREEPSAQAPAQRTRNGARTGIRTAVRTGTIALEPEPKPLAELTKGGV